MTLVPCIFLRETSRILINLTSHFVSDEEVAYHPRIFIHDVNIWGATAE